MVFVSISVNVRIIGGPDEKVTVQVTVDAPATKADLVNVISVIVGLAINAGKSSSARKARVLSEAQIVSLAYPISECPRLQEHDP